MVFVTAGMGGGTGTGAAPVIARIARSMDILTIGVVTKPFLFEGKLRMTQAEKGIEELQKYVDALIVIPNERLKAIQSSEKDKLSLKNAFQKADNVLMQAVQSITEILNMSGYVNLDFADVTSIMKDAGIAHMGIGRGEGKEKAEMAAKAAISSPLLETSIMGARGIIVNVTVSSDIGLEEVDGAMTMIQQEIHEDASLIFGVSFDDTLDDEMKVTVIATSFDEDVAARAKAEALKNEREAAAASARPTTPFTTTLNTPPRQPTVNRTAPTQQPAQTPSAAQQIKSANQDKDNSEDDAAQGEDFDDFDNIMDLLTPKKKNNNLFE